MTDWPPVIALIITYRRLLVALETIRSVKEKVDYSNIGFHIADDGSGIDYVRRLRDEIGDSYSVTATDSGRDGVGANMNMGIEACLQQADFWLHLEDDWVLREPLALGPCVRLLEEEPTVGMVRLGSLPGNLRGRTFGGVDRTWWRLEKGTDTYIFAGGAALRHRRFHDAYGRYHEGLLPGQTELGYCGRFNGRQGPDIVWPAWLSTEQAFQHIGSHQSFNWWMGQQGKTAEETAAIFEEADRDA